MINKVELTGYRINKEWPHLVIVFFVIFTIYLWSAPRTVVLEDDGYFILAAYFNGIAHPPGYPLFTILGHLSTWFPLGSIAYRVHALSSLLGVLSCCCLWWLARVLLKDRIYAYVTALSFGISKTFWSQAIIAEVYSLNMLLILLLVIMAMHLKYNNEELFSFKLAGSSAFVYGLGISNHWPLLILSTPMLLGILWGKWKLLFSHLLKYLPLIMLGLVPYIWMVVRSRMEPVISFYGPIESWSDFLFYVSRQGYAQIDSSLSAGWMDKLLFSLFVLRESASQFGSIGTVLVIIGFFRQWWVWPRSVCNGFILGFLGNSLILICLLDFDYDLLHRNIFRVYPLISYAVLSLWLGLGISFISSLVFQNKKLVLQKRLIETGFLLVITASVFSLNVKHNYRADDTWAKEYAMTVLNTLEPDSNLFTSGDLDQNPVGYLNLVEEVRPDIKLYHEKGLLYSNRLFYPGKNSLAERKKFIDEFILKTDQPIYYTYGLPHEYGVEDYGLYRRIVSEKPANFINSIAISEITQYFQHILAAGEPKDPWEAMHYRVLVSEYCRLSLHILEYSQHNAEEKSNLKDWINKICHTYHGKLESIDIFLDRQQPDWTVIDLLLDEAEILTHQSILKADHAKLYYYRAKVLERTGDTSNAVRNYRTCLKLWPHPDNPAYTQLKKLTGN